MLGKAEGEHWYALARGMPDDASGFGVLVCMLKYWDS